MEKLTDKELKNIYIECENIIDGVMKSYYQNEEILTCYNTIKEGDRVAQMLVVPYIQPSIEYTEILDETERGTNGFGSTGR